MKRQHKCLFAVFWILMLVSAPNVRAEATHDIAVRSSAKKVIPGGTGLGVILSTNGVLVVSTAEIESESGSLSPAQNAGIRAGDMITAYGGTKISDVAELNRAVASQGSQNSAVCVNRGGKNLELLISPALSASDNSYKIGAWVKDAASGIGTLTYYDPESDTFAALGHGICANDSEKVLEIDGGNILASTIVSVQKGERGTAGELNGVFAKGQEVLGSIERNTTCGIFGKADIPLADGEALDVAKKNEIHIGSAQILATVDGNTPKAYSIEIKRVMPQSDKSSKGMILQVTDSELIEKTGGIVRGMSGSPIIQDGKLIGAVTHVFLNDPTRGYGIFIENMLAEADKVE